MIFLCSLASVEKVMFFSLTVVLMLTLRTLASYPLFRILSFQINSMSFFLILFLKWTSSLDWQGGAAPKAYIPKKVLIISIFTPLFHYTFIRNVTICLSFNIPTLTGIGCDALPWSLLYKGDNFFKNILWNVICRNKKRLILI